jgi:hypothetical protein
MKNITITIFIIAFAVAMQRLFKTKKKGTKKMFTELDAKNAILFVADKYGVDMARTIEKMMRLETAHFTSLQYKKTGSAGMEIGKWANIPKGSTNGFIEMNDTQKPGLEKFIVWKSVDDFVDYLAKYIQRYNGNYLRWNAIDPVLQTQYEMKLKGVKARFV